MCARRGQRQRTVPIGAERPGQSIDACRRDDATLDFPAPHNPLPARRSMNDADTTNRPARRIGPSVLHPLMGADLATWWRAFTGNGWIPPDRWLHVAATGLAVHGRLPFTLLEHLVTAWRRRRMPPMRDPVFIIGHWRSGTTHLHNLLGCSPQYGQISPLASGLPWELLTLGTWLRPLLEKALPEDRWVDRVPVTPRSPQEDEIPLANMQPLSVFHALYFPRHFRRNFDRGVFFKGVSPRAVELWKRRMRALLEKVCLHQRADRLLIKNPVYTARISLLAGMFPTAKFIHIRRNPWVVFRSTVHYYSRLLPRLALQSFAHIDIPQFVEESYLELMRRYDAESAGLADDRLVEVAFEDLEEDALPVLERVYGQLGLAGFADDRPRFAAYLESLQGYRKNVFEFEPALLERVASAWHEYIQRWGYNPPPAVRA